LSNPALAPRSGGFAARERVEQLDGVLASVASEVAVVAVDHGQAGTHVAREIEVEMPAPRALRNHAVGSGGTADIPRPEESDASYAELCFSTSMTLGADRGRDRRVDRCLDKVSHGCRLRHVNQPVDLFSTTPKN
jgi:NCAIR mutase (PurE)-related protein